MPLHFCVERDGVRRELPSYSIKMYGMLFNILDAEWNLNVASEYDLTFRDEHIVKFRENGRYVRLRVRKGDVFKHWR